MRRLAVIALVFLACRSPRFPPQAVIAVDAVPQLGQLFRVPGPRTHHSMVSPSQTWPSYEVVAGGIEYTVGVDETMRVRYVGTTDDAFRPPEGLKRGDPLAAVLAAAPGETVVHEPGWGYFVLLPSGWYAFIDDGRPGHENLGTRPLAEDARVTMFFLRD